MSREVLQNMIDRILIVKAAEEKGLLLPQSYIDQEYDEVLNRDFGGDRGRFLTYLRAQGLTAREYRENIIQARGGQRDAPTKSQDLSPRSAPSASKLFTSKTKFAFTKKKPCTCVRSSSRQWQTKAPHCSGKQPNDYHELAAEVTSATSHANTVKTI